MSHVFSNRPDALVIPLALRAVLLHLGVSFLFGLHQIPRNAHGHAAKASSSGGAAWRR